jgi:GT2 family glycosyltransferase
VSVGIPSYNHAPFLGAAIESVLGQTLSDLELVIVEDGSRDGSLEIAQRYAARDERVTVLTHADHANLGLGPSVNLYRRRMSGRYVTGIGSDDVLHADALETVVAFLESRPEVGYAYGYARLIDESGAEVANARTLGADLTGDGRIVERLVQGNRIPAMTLLMRRECLEQAGDEDHDLVYSDWEFFTRAAAHWEAGFVPRCLAGQRVHATNTSVGASRSTNLQRALAVTEALRERAPAVGGRLAEPRVRATLELQLGFLRFAAGDESDAASRVRGAFNRDPTLARDGRWLGDWLWARLLDELLPDDGREFVPWLAGVAGPLLEPRAARGFRRATAAARREARAIRLARASRPTRAHRAALAAAAFSPRRAADRRLAAVLLDSVAGGAAGNWLRRARRQLLRSP